MDDADDELMEVIRKQHEVRHGALPKGHELRQQGQRQQHMLPTAGNIQAWRHEKTLEEISREGTTDSRLRITHLTTGEWTSDFQDRLGDQNLRSLACSPSTRRS